MWGSIPASITGAAPLMNSSLGPPGFRSEQGVPVERTGEVRSRNIYC